MKTIKLLLLSTIIIVAMSCEKILYSPIGGPAKILYEGLHKPESWAENIGNMQIKKAQDLTLEGTPWYEMAVDAGNLMSEGIITKYQFKDLRVICEVSDVESKGEAQFQGKIRVIHSDDLSESIWRNFTYSIEFKSGNIKDARDWKLSEFEEF